MKSRSRFLATSLIVLLSIGVFAVAGFLQAAESDQGNKEGQKAIMEGAKKMMDGNKMIMDLMTKKGMKDAEMTAAEKKMTDGYDMITKGESMMTGSTMTEGQAMVKNGSKMMLDAHKEISAAVDKKGMTQQCASYLSECTNGEHQINYGLQGSMHGGAQ
ncbi:MAG: hypothetical protein ABSF90_14020 [Syntrophobacteraceae bacterium]|jgi:hypothetical protein